MHAWVGKRPRFPDGQHALAGYQELAEIGRGGSAVVYKAWEEHLDRWVAIKILNVDLRNRKAQHRFTRERNITGRLSNHPHMVTVFDSGLIDGRRPFLVMALMERGSLAERVEGRGPLETDEALRVAIKIAGALETAHRTGVLHRDIKPQNILLSRFGEPALADFGIATLLEPNASVTGAMTPVHAAPELLEGDPPSVATDTYALGSAIFTLLAGEAPFAGPPGEGVLPQLMRIMTNDLPPLPTERVPRPLQDVLARAMAKTPEQRFASAAALGDALQAEQAGLGQPVTEMILEVDDQAELAPPAEAERQSAAARSGVAGAHFDRDTLAGRGGSAPLRSAAGVPAAGVPLADVLPSVKAASASDPFRGPAWLDAPTVTGRPPPKIPPRVPRRSRRALVAAVIGVGAVIVAVAAVLSSRGGGSPQGAPAGTGLTIGGATPTVPPVTSDSTASGAAGPSRALAPTNLTATVVRGQVVLHWMDHTGGGDSQLIRTYLSTSPNASPNPQVVPAGAVSAVVAGANPSAPACFRVFAIVGLAPSGAQLAGSQPACINGAVTAPSAAAG